MRFSFFIIINLFLVAFYAQTFSLDKELNEISGLEYLNDTLFVANNDGGNAPTLFLLNLRGNIVKKVLVSNAVNTDWEDLTADDTYIYIGDIGNNSNKRNDLKIYRVKKGELFSGDSIHAEVMRIAYADQKSYPPSESAFNFDSECLIFAYGFLWIFTKNNSRPFDGISKVYRFKFEKNSFQEIQVFTSIYLGKKGYFFDTPTSGDFQNDKFYLTTYNRWLTFQLIGSTFKLVNKKKFSEYNQREALTVSEDNSMWVANENNKLFGGPKLKRISLK